jgi:hypothetical protein
MVVWRASFRIEHRVAHQLLRNRGRTRRAFAAQVAHTRADRRDGIEALVLVEVSVLSGERRVLEIGCNVLELHNRPPSAGRIVDLPQQLPLAIENLRGFEAEAIRVVEHRDRRQRAEHGREDDAAGDRDRDQQHQHGDE